MNRLLVASAVASSFLVAAEGEAGTFIRTVVCSVMAGCDPGRPDTDASVIVNYDGIIYPISYLSTGLSPNVRVCVDSASFGGRLVPITEWAAEKWNAAVPALENSLGSERNEVPDPNAATGAYNAATVVLHELGHCFAGLGHTTLIVGEPLPQTPPPPRHPTSWTVSYDGARIGLNDGNDNIRGSFDDDQPAPAGGGNPKATNVFWFRKSDNNPVIIDATVIESTTYSPQLTDLPSPSTWPANANYGVTTDPLLGFAPNTVAVMGDQLRTGEVKFDLTADDVNVWNMSKTGVDRLVGGFDDHSIQLGFVPCDGTEDLRVEVGTTTAADLLGQCFALVGFVFPDELALPRFRGH